MASPKRGLGKGVDGLISQNTKRVASATPKQPKKEEKKEESLAVMMKVNEIEPNREQPRKKFEEDSLIELADSIKQFGVLEPLLIQKKKDYYEIISGERRWRAAKLAGVKEVPVMIKNLSEQEAVEIALIENIQREDLNPIDEAMAYKRLLNEFNLKQDEVAERVSKSRTAVTNSMRLLKLDERVQEMLIDDKISAGHGRALLALEDGEEQYTLAQRIFDERLNVRDIEKIIKDLKKPKLDKPAEVVATDSYIYHDLEEKMKSIMGTKVAINKKANGKGRVEIEFYSNSELERIFDLIMTISDN